MSISATPSSGTLHCARHPKTPTVLRCGRCETPICPRCLVATPVGARCQTCAGVKRFSLLLKPVELARAVGFGLIASAIGTIVLAFIPFLGILGYAALGFGVGEAVAVGANRKRVRELSPIAVVCLFVGYELGLVLLIMVSEHAPLSVDLLRVPLLGLGRGLVGVGLLLGALLAWMRVR